MNDLRTRTPTQSAALYTEEDWDDAMYALVAERKPPQPCPSCKRTGFYGPRARDGGAQHHSCRFCGFYQEVNGPAMRLMPVSHDCEKWPQVAKSSYLWWVMPGEQWFTCPYCKQRLAVKATNPFMKSAEAPMPLDHPDHGWWNVPQNMEYKQAYRYFQQWEQTKGQVFI